MELPKKGESILADLEPKTLVELSRSRIAAHVLMRRAENVLAFADSQTSTSIAHRVGALLPIVGKWHACFLENGIVGSYG